MTSVQLYALPDQVSGVAPLDGGALDGTVKARRKHAAVQSVMISLDKLEHHPDNTRKHYDPVKIEELAATMDEVGQLQDIVVCPQPDKGGHYWVIVGNRRLKAARLLDWADLRCVKRPTVIGAKATLKAMLIENWEHVDVSPIEKAHALGRLHHEESMTQQQIAHALGKNIATINGLLLLLDLDSETQARVERKEISVAAATKAVRKERAKARRKLGHGDIQKGAALSWAPDFFTQQHFLARRAQYFCDVVEGHNNRRLIGKTDACGHCWDKAIREHEAKIVKARLEAEIRDQIQSELLAVLGESGADGLTELVASWGDGNTVVMTRQDHRALA